MHLHLWSNVLLGWSTSLLSTCIRDNVFYSILCLCMPEANMDKKYESSGGPFSHEISLEISCEFSLEISCEISLEVKIGKVEEEDTKYKCKKAMACHWPFGHIYWSRCQ